MSGDRSALASPPPFDAARIARETFGDERAAGQLRHLADLLSRMRTGRSMAGGDGSTAKRLLESAAAAGEAFLAKLGEMSVFDVVDALRRGGLEPAGNAKAASEEPGPILPLRRDTEGVVALLTALQAMPERLRRAANATQRRRGRPSEAGLIKLCVEALLELWRIYRADPPTTAVKRGTFGALARDVLTAAPVGFSPSAVKEIVAEVLGTEQSGPSRKYAMTLKTVTPTVEADPPARPEPSRVLVVLADDGDQVGVELAAAYAAAKVSVILVTAPSQPVLESATPLLGERSVVPLAPASATSEVVAALRKRRRTFDTVVITGLDALPAEGRTNLAGGLPTVSDAAYAEHAVRRPAAVARLVRGIREAGRLRRGARIVVLVSPHGIPLQNPKTDRHLARAAMRSLAAEVGGVAADASSTEWVVALVSAGWGRDEDGPATYKWPASTAAALKDTISRLGKAHHGEVLDLAGARLPGRF